MGVSAQFGANLKRLREARGLSQEALGDLVGIGVPSLSRIENGRMWAKPETIDRLAQALDVDCAELFRNRSKEPRFEPSEQFKGALFSLFREATGVDAEKVIRGTWASGSSIMDPPAEHSDPAKAALVSVPAGVEAILGGLSESDANNLIRVMKDWVAHNVKTRSKSARA